MDCTNLDARQPAGYLAHSRNGNGSGVPELLCHHLQAVSTRAGRFAAAFGAEEQVFAAGLLHDLGKYADQFQRRLRDPRERGRDHWTTGALAALTTGPFGLLAALAIAGHHAGLEQLLDAKTLCRRVLEDLKNHADTYTEADGGLLLRRFTADGFPLPKLDHGLSPHGESAADMLDVRMLFSALVDADFLETEAHFNGDAEIARRPRIDGPLLDFDKAIAALDEHLESVRNAFRDAPMAQAREALYRACVAAAAERQGLFTLSAPTGSGKTLAMLAFALHHARSHGLRRVVLVMPFLNIIDQTAAIYRSLFNPDRGFDPNTVIEHHSLAEHADRDAGDDEKDGASNAARLLAENWDAPIVLTTTLQLFESLMADRPSRCRKLHRLAQSVILFDEVQTLPPSLAVATLSSLSRLGDPAGPYRSTVLFATATQPAFDALHARIRDFAAGGWQPTEIVAEAESLYVPAASRVRVEWRHEATIELDALADELQQHDRVLCIVNLKRHASRLASSLRERGVAGVLHLSTNMCPAHRTEVLKTVNSRLRRGKSVRLIATQCVEAGVDLDFPVVYRAIAPLEAIGQAAGRCNRHGRRDPGRVIVFKPHDDRKPYPPGYGEGVDATQTFLALLKTQGDLNATEILNSPQNLRAYFRYCYGLSGRASGELDDERPLHEAIRAGDFKEVARLYKLIKQDSINVLVPYNPQAFEQLSREIRETDPLTPDFICAWRRRATPHAVSLFRPQNNSPLAPHLEPVQFSRRHPVEWWQADWFIALPGIEYDALLGVAEKTEDVWIV